MAGQEPAIKFGRPRLEHAIAHPPCGVLPEIFSPSEGLPEVRGCGDFAVPFVNLVKDPNGVLIRSDRFIRSPSLAKTTNYYLTNA